MRSEDRSPFHRKCAAQRAPLNLSRRWNMRPALAPEARLRYAGHMNWGNLSSGLLGGIIGAVLATLGAWLIEQALWARDCRKQEWRQLLDAVSELQSAIVAVVSGLWDGRTDRVSNAQEALSGTVNDRLFIPERQLQSVRAAVERIPDPGRHHAPSAARCADARTVIADAARRDLRIAAAPRWRHVRRHRTVSGEPERTDANASGKQLYDDRKGR